VSGLYVFALAGEPCETFETSGHVIEFVRSGDVYAAVERAERPPAVSEQALRGQHVVVAELGMRVDALLPVRFGAFVDAGELQSMVVQRQDVITEALRLVRGRCQMTVRLLQRETESPGDSAPPAAHAQSGTEYLESRRQLRSAIPSPLAAVSEAVRHIVVAQRLELARGRFSTTLYHLVGKKDVQEYRERAAVVKRADDGTLAVTGPWAPFAFAPDLWE
jgi:hypothetical protein